MKKIVWIIIVLLLPLSAGAQINTIEQARDLLSQADLARGNAAGIEWDIDIESRTADRSDRNRLHVIVKDINCLAVYQTPAKVKGRKLLMHDRNMWFIKPGLSKPVPISPRQKLLGGASNGDIASTNYAGDYIIEGFDKDRINNEDCMVFDLKAKTKKVTYDRIRYWVSVKSKTGVKSEFFTASGKMFKTAVFEYENRVSATGGTRPFVSKMIITNAVVKTDVTTMVYQNVKITDVPASAFNINLLVR